MGRHAAPGTGRPTPDRGFWVRLAAVVVAVAIVAAYLLSSGDDTTTTAEPRDRAPSTAAQPSSAPASPSPSTPPASTSPAAERPPTLAFRVLRPSYITVRVPGGRTLVSKLFRKGARREFDQKVLQVVNGRPTAVRFTVNGSPRKPGPADRPETFTVRRA